MRGVAGGGSATTRRPPTRRNAAAHSAVTAGAPNARAVTVSKTPRQRTSCPASSALAAMTETRDSRPSHSTASWRKPARRALPSRRATSSAGQRAASASPGTPPPDPRSSSADPGSPIAAPNASACRRWDSTGTGPSSPASRARSKTVRRSRDGEPPAGVTPRVLGRAPRSDADPRRPTGRTRRGSSSPCRARSSGRSQPWARVRARDQSRAPRLRHAG